MDTNLLGRIIAAYLLVSGLGFLFSSDFYLKMRAHSPQSDPLVVNLAGMVHFILGMGIVLTHHLWGSVLQFLVTLTGVGFIAKGFALIVFPEFATRSAPTSRRTLRLSGGAFVVAGLVFGYLSYLA
jgi:uncharacterized protein YjeT (DUF2065 family)